MDNVFEGVSQHYDIENFPLCQDLDAEQTQEIMH